MTDGLMKYEMDEWTNEIEHVFVWHLFTPPPPDVYWLLLATLIATADNNTAAN